MRHSNSCLCTRPLLSARYARNLHFRLSALAHLVVCCTCLCRCAFFQERVVPLALGYYLGEVHDESEEEDEDDDDDDDDDDEEDDSDDDSDDDGRRRRRN
eukprot:GHVT01088397.1.p1 GENE.GHVT01088397.1~~GHVT01088397.1.p1  ORF type:complete len:100 (-),score=17.78 GHVT01088397.1:640-939(-)